MQAPGHQFQKRLSNVAFLAGVVLIVLLIVWPAFAEAALVSRLRAGLLVIWFFGVGFLVHPEIREGLAEGIRAFNRNDDDQL